LNKKFLILLLTIVFAVNTYAQQGIVLSQPYINAQFLSPATVGNGIYEHRIQSNLKSQFLDGNNLYRTLVSGWDSRLKNADPEQKNYFGIGAQVISDQVMAGLLNSNYVSLGFAYHLFLDANLKNELSLGIGGTYGQTYLDRSKLRFGEGFNIDGSYTASNYDYLNSIKSFPQDFYFNTGLLYTRHTENMFLQGGLSASFLSRPKVTILAVDTASGMKSSAFFNFEKVLESGNSFMTHFSFVNKNGLNQIVVGGLWSFPFKDKADKVNRIYVGCFSRLEDAIIPSVSIMMDKYTLGLSYDIYNNDLSGAKLKQNGFEIALSVSLGKKRNEWMRTIFD
jgi:type IX secretion system PorP/SprF family membrane protein